jgi:Carboxypeptidase regulatory-like domain
MMSPSAGIVIALLVLQVASLPGTISGIVIKSGTLIQQPLQNARVELTGGPGTPLVTRTDGNGRFVFSNLADGQYEVAITSDGFIRQRSTKRISVRGGQQSGNIVFALDPAPTAAGLILDSYGEPIANVMVEALRRTYDVRGNPRLLRTATAVTDDRGVYRIFWLDPGEYFFYASENLPESGDTQPVRAVAATYYPGVGTPDDAMPLRLGIGREIRVDFRLRRDAALWTVNGQTMNAATSRAAAAIIALTPPAEDPNLSRYRAQSSAAGPSPGQFSIGNVVPGSYILMAKSVAGEQEMTAFQRIVLRPLPVTPREGYGISLALSPPLSINGHIFVESSEAMDLRKASVSLVSVDPDLPSPRSVFAQPDGQFYLNGAVPGTYVLDIENLPEDLYVKGARFGSDDILEKSLMLQTRLAGNPLQVLLGSDGGRLRVAVYNDKGQPQSDAQLVLVPDGARRSRREQYRLATSGEDGQAILRGIPPGRYKLFAWEELEPNAYMNSSFMQAYESLGVPVDISSGDNPSASAKLIPKE